MYYKTDIEIPSVMKETGISATAAMVLFWINRYIYASRLRNIRDRRGIPYSFASAETLAQKIGKSVRTVERATAELRRAGMIEVKRTRKYAHTFMQWQAVYDTDGGSGTDKNGGSIKNQKHKNAINVDYQSKDEQLREDRFAFNGAAMNAETTRPTAAGQMPAPAAEGRPAGPRDRTKHAPTPKRPKRTAAKREEFKRHMLKRLCSWIPFDADGMDEQKRLEALADMIADASSASGRQIVVNGAGLTAGQYWEVVKAIEYSGDIAAMLDRIDMRRASSGIKNLRAYTLAAVYNYCQQAEAMRGAGWTIRTDSDPRRRIGQTDSNRGNYGGEVDDGWMREYLAGA